MPYSIAFVGYDGSGKTTLIRFFSSMVKGMVCHQNKLSRLVYRHQQSKVWEAFNLIEITCRNLWWRLIHHSMPLILDRCYLCALVYSRIEGYPEITLNIRKHAYKPDIVCVLEPVEELVYGASRFVVEYHTQLQLEGYVCFDARPYPMGQITFWKRPDIPNSPVLDCYTYVIGELGWQTLNL